MKVLYLLSGDPDRTVAEIIEESGKTHEVTVLDLRKEDGYEKIVTLLEECDKVISW